MIIVFYSSSVPCAANLTPSFRRYDGGPPLRHTHTLSGVSFQTRKSHEKQHSFLSHSGSSGSVGADGRGGERGLQILLMATYSATARLAHGS